MKEFFARLGFRRMDEMEQGIAVRAQLWGYRFLIFALLGWSLHSSWAARSGQARLDLRPAQLLLAAFWVQTGIQFFLQRRAVSGDEEYRAPSLLRTIAPVALVTAVVAALGVFLLVAGR